jgi:hypothetical protein
MKIKPAPRVLPSLDYRNSEHHRDKLIHLIDELILKSDNIHSSLRLTTSTGITNNSRCINLYNKLKSSTDDRSIRICNLLVQLIKMID